MFWICQVLNSPTDITKAKGGKIQNISNSQFHGDTGYLCTPQLPVFLFSVVLGARTYNKQLVHLLWPLLQCLGCLQEVLLFLCHLCLLHLQLPPLAVESVLLTLKFLSNYVLFALLLGYRLHQGFKFCLSLPLKINTCIG